MKMRAKKNRYGGWKEQTLLFLVSQSITLFGSTLVQMAVIWYATRATSSGRWVAVFYICSWLPQFFVSFMGGVFADRYDRKKLIISADTATALITLCMAVTMGIFRKEQDLLAALIVMSFLRSVSAGIQTPAVNAVIPQLVPGEDLIRYNGINAAMQSVVQFAAPAAAGAVLTGGNLHSTLMIDVVTAIVGTLILLCVKLPAPVHRSPVHGSSVSTIRKSCRLIFQEMGEGFKYVFSCKKLKKFLLFYGMFTFLGGSNGICRDAGGQHFHEYTRQHGRTENVILRLTLVRHYWCRDGDGRKFPALSCSDDRIRSGNDSRTDASDGNCPET